MGLSSKLTACIGLGLLVADPAQAAPVARPAILPVAHVMPRPVPRVIRGGDLGHRFARRRLGRGYGYAGLGLAGLGLGVAGYGLDAGDGLGDGAPPPMGPYGAPPRLPPPVILQLPPACPLIIKVGRGLTHAVKTQVVYGRPVCRP